MKKENTNNETGFFNKIKSFCLQFLYALTITLPYSTSYNYKLISGVILFSILSIFSQLLYPLYQYHILLKNGVIFLSLFIAIIISGLELIYKKYIVKFLDKTFAQKLYWIDINAYNKDNYSELVATHRKYGRYNEHNKIKYITDNNLINEYKKYNIKWRIIAIIYLIITIISFYSLDRFK